MRAFVFTGMAFLMAIPALILAASLVNMAKIGDTTTILVMKSDKAAYSFNSIAQSFQDAAENLVNVYGKNVTKIQDELVNWAIFIEQNFSKEAGLNVSILEERINVTYDNSTGVQYVYVGDVSDPKTKGIEINVSLLSDSSFAVKTVLGPLEIIIPPENIPPEVNITEIVYTQNGTSITQNINNSNLSCTVNYTFKGYAWDEDGGIKNVFVLIDAVQYNANFSSLEGIYHNWSYIWHPEEQKQYEFCAQSQDDENIYSNEYCIIVYGDASCGVACSLIYVLGSGYVTGKSVYFSIENVNSSDVTVENMTVSWEPTEDNKLTRIKFDNQQKWSGSADSGKTVDIDDTLISSGATPEVRLDFSGKENMDNRKITVIFHLNTNENCTINFTT